MHSVHAIVVFFFFFYLHTTCGSSGLLTWVDVQLALHRLGDALQLDGLQRAVCLDGGRQAAQCLPDEAGHITHGEDLQQLAVDGWEGPQEHSLRDRRESSGEVQTLFIL